MIQSLNRRTTRVINRFFAPPGQVGGVIVRNGVGAIGSDRIPPAGPVSVPVRVDRPERGGRAGAGAV
ncbi:hypothetical protein GCM10010433_46690 [Streptomyces pulveraceus]